MAEKEIFCAFAVDLDAVAGWLGTYGGEDSPDDISRGMFAGEVGTPRLLYLFEEYDLKTTWFVPGHSIETFPEQCKAIVDGGHEIGTHGYSHENPVSMTPQQERDVIEKCIELVEGLTGKKPAGNSAPWWEPSDATNEIMLEYGYKYDRSLQHNDFTPYYARKGDTWSKVDYSQSASEWMKPLQRGEEIDLIKIPPNWYLDDLPPMMFIKANPNSHGFMNPDVSGRPQNLLMLERLIDYINRHPGVQWKTFEEIADDFAERQPRGEPARVEGLEHPS